MQRGNAYASLIHMTKSSGNMMVSFQFFLYLSVLLGRVLSSLFFGQLRASEVEHLYEKSWFAVTETALAMTIFRDEFDVKFVALFLGLLGVKIFHWIMADRVDYVRSPSPPRHMQGSHLQGIGCWWASMTLSANRHPHPPLMATQLVKRLTH
jgi:hypothetical protein